MQAPCTILKQIFEYLTITDRRELAVTSQNNQDELDIDQARKNRQVEYEHQKAVTITRAAVAFLVAKELCRLRCTEWAIHDNVYNFRERMFTAISDLETMSRSAILRHEPNGEMDASGREQQQWVIDYLQEHTSRRHPYRWGRRRQYCSTQDRQKEF